METNDQILVADDDREIRTLLAKHLDANGLRALTAQNGKEIQHVLEQVRIDLIVPPPMSGWRPFCLM